jgi:chromatin structure-remodeling complex subunit RSC1/2
MDLPDRVTWANYYNIITEPRSLNGIQEKLSRNRYRVTLEAFDDMSLVFKNAMYFNEESSQLSQDAAILLVRISIRRRV